MPIRYAFTIAASCVALAACQPGGPGLTGAARDSFLQSATASCNQAARGDPRAASINAGAIAQYCTCYSTKMADTISYAELEEFTEGLKTDPRGATAKLQPRIDAATQACSGLLKAQ